MASVVLIMFWIASSMAITVAGLLHVVAPSLPQFLQDLLLYGKIRGKRKTWSLVQLFEIPKSWFLHFYMMGVLVNGYMIYVTATSYLTGAAPPAYVTRVYDFLVDENEENIGAGAAMLLISMMLFQVSRRLYECLFVSVYSKGTMNLAHYALGLILYSTFSFAILAEAPPLGQYKVSDLSLELLKFRHFLGLGLFFWASWHHHEVHVMFANLRKDREGKVKGYKHSIPMGGWFEYVSCPHYLAEIIIYLSFLVVARTTHHTLMAIVIFVVDNQLVAGYLTHTWYLEEFQTRYPKDRKAVIPFLL